MERFLLSGGNEELPALRSAATMAGLNVIELLWTKTGRPRKGSVTKIAGFEKVVMPRGASRNLLSDENYGKARYTDCVTYFYPDNENLNYGYIVDTEKNRGQLARLLKCGWVRIMDPKVLEEVKGLARELGLPTERVAKEQIKVKKSVRERLAEEQAAKAKTDAEKMKEENEELKRLIQEMQDKGEAKLAKPLSGVKIKDRDKLKDKEVDLEDLSK